MSASRQVGNSIHVCMHIPSGLTCGATVIHLHMVYVVANKVCNQRCFRSVKLCYNNNLLRLPLPYKITSQH